MRSAQHSPAWRECCASGCRSTAASSVVKGRAELSPSGAQWLWIIDIDGILITVGTLGDRIGRRKLLLIGATAPEPPRAI